MGDSVFVFALCSNLVRLSYSRHGETESSEMSRTFCLGTKDKGLVHKYCLYLVSCQRLYPWEESTGRHVLQVLEKSIYDWP